MSVVVGVRDYDLVILLLGIGCGIGCGYGSGIVCSDNIEVVSERCCGESVAFSGDVVIGV